MALSEARQRKGGHRRDRVEFHKVFLDQTFRGAFLFLKRGIFWRSEKSPPGGTPLKKSLSAFEERQRFPERNSSPKVLKSHVLLERARP